MAEPRLADLKIAHQPEQELAGAALGPERLRLTVQPTIRRARKPRGVPSTGLTMCLMCWWEPEPGRWAPSRFNRASPSLELAALPLVTKVLLDACGVAFRQGVLTAEHFAAAGLKVPE